VLLTGAHVGAHVVASMISTALTQATPEEAKNLPSIPKADTGHKLRIAGQCLFLGAIIVAYVLLYVIYRKAKRLDTPRRPLILLLSTAPFLLVRGAYGLLSSADWAYSYYLPSNVSTALTESDGSTLHMESDTSN
jgi:hypothetical protein